MMQMIFHQTLWNPVSLRQATWHMKYTNIFDSGMIHTCMMHMVQCLQLNMWIATLENIVRCNVKLCENSVVIVTQHMVGCPWRLKAQFSRCLLSLQSCFCFMVAVCINIISMYTLWQPAMILLGFRRPTHHSWRICLHCITLWFLAEQGPYSGYIKTFTGHLHYPLSSFLPDNYTWVHFQKKDTSSGISAASEPFWTLHLEGCNMCI